MYRLLFNLYRSWTSNGENEFDRKDDGGNNFINDEWITSLSSQFYENQDVKHRDYS